jgi:hypothetical protein
MRSEYEDDMMARMQAHIDLEECAKMGVTHFGIPVAWSLTMKKNKWSGYAPLPESTAMGEIHMGEA